MKTILVLALIYLLISLWIYSVIREPEEGFYDSLESFVLAGIWPLLLILMAYLTCSAKDTDNESSSD